jgi:hypothetical protein
VNQQHAWIASQLELRALGAFEGGNGPYVVGTMRARIEPRAHELAHWICLGEPGDRRSITQLLNGALPRSSNKQEAMTLALELDALAALGMIVSESRLLTWALDALMPFHSDVERTDLLSSDPVGVHAACRDLPCGGYRRWLLREVRKTRATKAHAKRVARFVHIIHQGNAA